MKKSSIIIVVGLMLVGCSSQYELSSERCRDKNTGQFVKMELCNE